MSIERGLIDQVKSMDVSELAGFNSELRKSSAREFCGPCPKCGGHDRFYVSDRYFGCRHCKRKTNGAINYTMWLEGCGFVEAVERLSNQVWEANRRRPEAKRVGSSTELGDESWQNRAKAVVRSSCEALTPSSEGHAYLVGRGISEQSYKTYLLGYSRSVAIPGTNGKERSGAISMPWIVGGKIRGIRYRFLEVQDGAKQTAFSGSSFSGCYYGGHAMQRSGGDTLLIVEGELNAISCRQVAPEGCEVLSVGCESTHITESMARVREMFDTVIIWMDREEIVRGKQEAFSGSFGVSSPEGKDANDLLQLGILGEFIAKLIQRAK